MTDTKLDPLRLIVRRIITNGILWELLDCGHRIKEETPITMQRRCTKCSEQEPKK